MNTGVGRRLHQDDRRPPGTSHLFRLPLPLAGCSKTHPLTMSAVARKLRTCRPRMSGICEPGAILIFALRIETIPVFFFIFSAL